MQNAKIKMASGMAHGANCQHARHPVRICFSLFSLVVALVISSTASKAQDTIAVKAGKIITISGPVIDNGVVLVRNGKIAAVGKSVEIPAGAKVLEAAVVMPGMVEAHSARGMDAPNENVPVVPFVNTSDGVDPLHFSFEDALRDGITTVHVIQGNATVVGGTGCIVRPAGGNVEAIMVKKPSAMKLSLSPSGGRNRITQIAELRKAFDDYDLYVQQLSERRAEQKKSNQPEEEFDGKQLAMKEMVEGRLPVFIYCPKDADVARAIELIDARKLKATLVLGADCYKSAGLVAKKNLRVVLDPQLVVWETDEDQDREVSHVLPAIYQRAGVKFAFQVQAGNEAGRYLWYQAATAVKYGVPRDVALRAITLTAAEIAGVGDRVGSIDTGKDANLLLMTGDPLDVKTWVDTVLIYGKVAYERKNDTRLQRLITGKEGQ